VAIKRLMKLELQPPRPKTRRIARRPADAPVILRSSHGEQARAEIRDISVYGCSLACTADFLRGGTFVSLGLASDWSIQAIVRWSRAGLCGVEFLRPISAAEARAIADD